MTGDGLTPLGLAVSRGELDIIKYLIMECNVDVNGKLVTRAQLYQNKSTSNNKETAALLFHNYNVLYKFVIVYNCTLMALARATPFSLIGRGWDW